MTSWMQCYASVDRSLCVRRNASQSLIAVRARSRARCRDLSLRMTFIRGKSSAEAGNWELGADKRTSAVWESLLGRPPCFSSFVTSRKLSRATLDASHASMSFVVNEVVFDAWARSQSRTLARETDTSHQCIAHSVALLRRLGIFQTPQIPAGLGKHIFGSFFAKGERHGGA